MFGREARLPVDLCFGTSPDGIEETSRTQYVTKLKEDLKQAYKLASDAADKRHQRNKKLYDRRVSFQSIEIGDRVLLRNLGLKGKHKLESKWSPDPYVVIGKMPNLPVFKIKREDGRLGTKTIHRDHLLPIGQMVRMPCTDQDVQSPTKPKTRADTHKRSQRNSRKETLELQEFSDSSSDMEYYIPHCVTRKEPVQRVRNTARPVVELEDDPETEHENDPVAEHVHEIDSDPEEVDDNCEPESEDEECDPKVALEETSEAGSESEEEVSEVQEDKKQPSSEPRPKRNVKPAIRLTYDEPGKSRDEPLTIVHRGIVIKIGKHYTH